MNLSNESPSGSITCIRFNGYILSQPYVDTPLRITPNYIAAKISNSFSFHIRLNKKEELNMAGI